jgi:HSP20 family protein
MRIRELVPWRSRERGELSTGGERDPFFALQTQMQRLFDDFSEGFEPALREPAGMPKVDVAETEDSIQVTADLPGLTEKDVDVTLSDGSLVIRGQKEQQKEDKNKNYHRIERSYGAFHRVIDLPAPVDESKVDASFRNGVLTVLLPKTEPSSPGKRIEVRRAD